MRSPRLEQEIDLATRSAAAVLEDHLRLRAMGNLDADLRRNYDERVLLLTSNSILRGHDAIRASAGRLGLQLPNARFDFIARQVADEFAFLVWEARSDRWQVRCGADSFHIVGGKIRMQTIHYRLLTG